MNTTVAQQALEWLKIIGAKPLDTGTAEKFKSHAVELNGCPMEIIEPKENGDKVAFMVTAVIFGGMTLKMVDSKPELVESFMAIQGAILQAAFGLLVQEQRVVNPRTNVEEDAIVFQFKSVVGYDATMDSFCHRAQKMVNYRQLVHDSIRPPSAAEEAPKVKVDNAYG